MTSESATRERDASTVTCYAGGNGSRGEEERRAQDELTTRFFQALYRDFDLYTVGGTHVVVHKGTRGSPGQIGKHRTADQRARVGRGRRP